MNQTERQWGITASLRNRKNYEQQESERILAENTSLEKQIQSHKQELRYIDIAGEIFEQYIQGGSLKKMIIATRPLVSLTSSANGFEPKFPAMFNRALERHGFILSTNNTSITIEGNRTSIELCLLETQETNGFDIMRRIQSGFDKEGDLTRQSTKSENEYFGQIQVSKDAVSRKKQEILDKESLRQQIVDAEDQINWNNWRLEYMKLASHCFLQLFRFRGLTEIDLCEFDDTAPMKLYSEFKESGGTNDSRHIVIFQECLKLHGLHFVGIESPSRGYYNSERDHGYRVDLAYRSESFEGGELLNMD